MTWLTQLWNRPWRLVWTDGVREWDAGRTYRTQETADRAAEWLTLTAYFQREKKRQHMITTGAELNGPLPMQWAESRPVGRRAA